jgi:uncharacterized protein YifE (UPF0438 family)
MSTAEELVDSGESLEEVVRDLAARVTELEAENESLRSRVEELESQPRLEWDGESPHNIQIRHPEMGFPYPIGSAAAQNLPEGFSEEDLTAMENDIQALKRGAVDELDLVTGAEPDLPIEQDIAKAGDENLRDDLSANELRAVQIFRKFGARATSWSGTMKLESADVRNILEDAGGSEPNPNTVRRAMKMLAKKTSDASKGDRSPDAKDENLIWTHKGNKRQQLRAEKEEWLDYMQEVEERYSP